MYRSIGLSFLNLIPPPSRLSIGGRYPAHIYVSIHLYSLDAALLGDSFRQAPVLRMPDVNLPFILQTDASDCAIGAVLMQADENGDLHPCGYLSHALTPTETRWQIYDRELYAIYYALFKEWRYLLEGADHPVTIQ